MGMDPGKMINFYRIQRHKDSACRWEMGIPRGGPVPPLKLHLRVAGKLCRDREE